jgi:hypothetical protein
MLLVRFMVSLNQPFNPRAPAAVILRAMMALGPFLCFIVATLFYKLPA